MKSECLFNKLLCFAVILGLLSLTSAPASADPVSCETAKKVPQGYTEVANGLLGHTTSFKETIQAGQVVYVEIKNANVLGGPVALRIRGPRRADGGTRDTICATDLIVLPQATTVLWTAVFGDRVEYEVDAQIKPGSDAGPLTVKVYVKKP